MRCRLILAAAFCAVPVVHADSVLAGSAAVLPFTDVTVVPAAANSWVGESAAEALREAFLIRGSTVISRADVGAAYNDLRLRPSALLTQASVLKLGESMNADSVVYGTYRVAAAGDPQGNPPGMITLQATISDRAHVRLAGPLEESGPLTELDRLEAHLAWQVLRALSLAPEESQFLSLRPPVRVNAEENFIRGLLAAPADREKFYQQAARADLRFARPALELAKIELARKNYKGAADWLTKIPATDIHSPEAMFYLGVARFHQGDYAQAQTAFEAVTHALPIAEVYNNLGVIESRRNSFHALASFREALELNPTLPDYHFNMGYILFKTGQYKAATDRFRAVLDRDPSDQAAIVLLGRSIQEDGLHKGSPADARFVDAERFRETFDQPLYRSAPAPRSLSPSDPHF